MKAFKINAFRAALFLALPSSCLADCSDFSGQNISDGVIGKYSLAQLWNPASSSKNLVVTKITAAVTAWEATPSGTRANDIVVQTAAFPNNTGNAQCKNIGDASAPVGLLRSTQLDASDVTGFKPFHEFWFGASEVDHTYTFDPPIVIPPGYGIAVRGGQTAMYVVTSWQWSEVPIKAVEAVHSNYLPR
jgi:hypothetical protein